MTVTTGNCDCPIRVTRGLLEGLDGVLVRRQRHGGWIVQLNDFPAGVYFLLQRSAFEIQTSQTPAAGGNTTRLRIASLTAEPWNGRDSA